MTNSSPPPSDRSNTLNEQNSLAETHIEPTSLDAVCTSDPGMSALSQMAVMAGIAFLNLEVAKAEAANFLENSPSAVRLFERLVMLKGKSSQSSAQAVPVTVTVSPTNVQTLHSAQLPVLRRQEKIIIDWLKANGYNPEKLPKRVNGKATVKSSVKKALNGKGDFSGKTTFDKAWDRLRSGKEIEEES